MIRPLYKVNPLSDWDFSEWPLKSSHFWSFWISCHSAVLMLLLLRHWARRQLLQFNCSWKTKKLSRQTIRRLFLVQVRGKTCFCHLTYLQGFYVLKIIEIITLTAVHYLYFYYCFCSVLIWLGGVHKLRLQDLSFFDRLPPSVYIFYGTKVCKKSIFLTTYPPLLVNVVCERPLTLQWRWKGQKSGGPLVI